MSTETLKTDGIQGIYRGFVISCVGIFVYRGMYFGLYDTLKPMLLGQDGSALLSFFLVGQLLLFLDLCLIQLIPSVDV